MPRPYRLLLRWISDRQAHAWGVLLLGLSLTGVFWVAADALREETLDQRFRFRQTEVVTALRERFTAYEQVLRGARGLLRASDVVDRDEWRVYVASLDLESRYPGIQGVGYARWTGRDELAAVEAMVQEEGFGGFRVWPEGTRDAYAPILLLEPFDLRNRRALGFDMWSEETRRAAMREARATGLPTVSGKVRLVQETRTDPQNGFLIYLPFYGLPGPAGPEESDERLKGFVYAPFRMRDFMDALAGPLLDDLRLRIYSGAATAEETLLYDSAAEPDEQSPPAGARRATVELALQGIDWTLEFQALPGFTVDAGEWTPPMIVALGSLFSLLGFAAVRYAAGLRREQARAAALGQVIEAATTEVYVMDARSLRVLQANRGARNNLGYDREQLRGMRLTDLQPDVAPARFRELTRPLRRGMADQATYGATHRRRDGSRYEAEVTLQLHRNWSPPVYHALVQDVTERKRHEKTVADALAEARGLLAEKETLLREVHHRVKNNLQVIWSLIRLEAGDIRDPQVRERLDIVAQRISVLGQIHQQLYSAENLAHVDIGRHVRQLAESMAELHAHRGIAIDARVEPVTCDLETAIPLGLIANELISNSLEHAFAAERAGVPARVRVTVERRDGRVLMEVADNGIGRTDGDAPLREGLGLRLVDALARQLDAEVTVDRAGGTCTTVLLPEVAMACAADDGSGP